MASQPRASSETAFSLARWARAWRWAVLLAATFGVLGSPPAARLLAAAEDPTVAAEAIASPSDLPPVSAAQPEPAAAPAVAAEQEPTVAREPEVPTASRGRLRCRLGEGIRTRLRGCVRIVRTCHEG